MESTHLGVPALSEHSTEATEDLETSTSIRIDLKILIVL